MIQQSNGFVQSKNVLVQYSQHELPGKLHTVYSVTYPGWSNAKLARGRYR